MQWSDPVSSQPSAHPATIHWESNQVVQVATSRNNIIGGKVHNRRLAKERVKIKVFHPVGRVNRGRRTLRSPDAAAKLAVLRYLAHHQHRLPSAAVEAVAVAIIIGKNLAIRAPLTKESIARVDLVASTTNLAGMASSHLHPLRATPRRDHQSTS